MSNCNGNSDSESFLDMLGILHTFYITVVVELTRLFYNEHKTEDKDIIITVTGVADPIKGNQTELYELVYNLMDNAVKYNRQGGNIDVVLSGKTIRISDTGIGIPEKDRQRIFERFYRVDNSRSKATGGTGLGLSIVKHVAEKHNATITVKSTLNVGTDITVDFNGAKA